MNRPAIAQLLIDAGFDDGWAIAGDVLVLWEHDSEPPSPLVRPANAPTDSASHPAE